MGKLSGGGQRGKWNGKVDVIKVKNSLLKSVQSLMSWLFTSHNIKNRIENMFILYIVSQPFPTLSSWSRLRSFNDNDPIIFKTW